MADRYWGALKSDEDLPFAIAYGQGAPGMSVNPYGNGYTSGGSFTMPWAGNLVASYTGVVSWAQGQHQHAVLYLSDSSPGPTTYSSMLTMAHNRLTIRRYQLPVNATWANLAKGQTVSFTIRLGVGGGAVAVTLEWWAGTIRAWPG